jgi:hypothetical protein
LSHLAGSGLDAGIPPPPGDLRSLFQTLPLTRDDAVERCDFDNDQWTWRDGFQTLPARSEP